MACFLVFAEEMVDVAEIQSVKKKHKEKSKRKRENENDTCYAAKTSQMSSKTYKLAKVARIKNDKKAKCKKGIEISKAQSNALGEEDSAIDAEPDHIDDEQDVSNSIKVARKKKDKKLPRRKKKEESERQIDVPDEGVNYMDAEPSHSVDEQNDSSFEMVQKKKKKKLRQRKENEESEGQSDVPSDQLNHIDAEADHCVHEQNDNSFEVGRKKKDKKFLRRKKKDKRESQSDVSGQSKKDSKKRRKDHIMSREGESSEKSGPVVEDIYEISSGDEDNSKGMRKWLMEYHQSRPGLKVLQQRIDEFMVAHEEKLEQERKEREALAAEGGWTVVTHHKGRKKTTDLESGTVIGSVSQAALEEKMAKKKRDEVALDFYRFQRREAQRNELMELQSKFEQDKKRIQQLRAARKFRPY